VVVTLSLFLGTAAFAQERGFALTRLDAAPVGSSGFLVARPWYSSTRYFAAGITADYALNPLVPLLATGGGDVQPIVAHSLLGHVEVAGSLFDRLLLDVSMPITLLERGASELVSQTAPLAGVGFGDPRVGLMVRLAGQAETDPISLHLGVTGWIPLGGALSHQGDPTFRLMPRVVLAGAMGSAGRWAIDGALLLRPYSSLGPPALGLTSSSELRVGASLGLAFFDGRFTIGPEARFSTQLVGVDAFATSGMSLELLGGANVWLFDVLQVGVAGGAGLLGAAGTPDARGIVRLAFAPRRSEPKVEPVVVVEDPAKKEDADDPDGDRIVTAADRCPYEPETFNGVRDDDGCPELVIVQNVALARVLVGSREAVRDSVSAGTGSASSEVAGTGSSSVEARRADAGPADARRADSLDAGTRPASVVDAGRAIDPVDAGRREGDSVLTAGVDRAATFVTTDADGDGVPDVEDRCPVTKEDADGFEDDDGCPELDNDADGLVDSADRCPIAAETMNGFDDEDGCPDLSPDADQDGIADTADRCPFEAETRDGVRDDDGCPELEAPPALAKLITATTVPSRTEALAPVARPESDSDGDAVVDALDRCPVTDEDADGFEDEDGCPEPDNDGDGLADAADRCPLESETFNDWQDTDGCPDAHQDLDGDGFEFATDRCPEEAGAAPDGCPRAPLPALALPGFPAEKPAATEGTTETRVADLDRDAVPDEEDTCPMSGEDLDGFEDDDGCAEPDNDRDGVADAVDACPLVAETINGVKDEDGCPDVGVTKVSIQNGAVVIKGVVRFQSGSATLTPASMPLLREVAATLKAASTLSIEIRGHTDDVGNAAKNIKLSQRRSETIRGVLIKFGVAPARLVATGFGPTKPIATNKTAAGREQNRRVEFLILGESK
jgi:outer membrane protein OmpA-like peptidoglycan-associated protein